MGVQRPQREWALLGECVAHCKVSDFGGLGKKGELCKQVDRS